MHKAWILTAEKETAQTVAEAARVIRLRGGRFSHLKLEGLLEAALVILKEEGLTNDVKELVYAAAGREDVQIKTRKGERK